MRINVVVVETHSLISREILIHFRETGLTLDLVIGLDCEIFIITMNR